MSHYGIPTRLTLAALTAGCGAVLAALRFGDWLTQQLEPDRNLKAWRKHYPAHLAHIHQTLDEIESKAR